MELTEQHKMARVATKAGLSIVPPREDGTKAPLGTWLRYQRERPSREQIDEWYEGGREGIGVVCGAISGNLTMLEFEDDDTWQLYRDNAESTGLGEVLGRVASGWMERTPGGGVHLYYQCSDVRGNKKLAKRPTKPEERLHEHDFWRTLIETRGEGGYSVISPSCGRTHETGLCYELLSGGPRTLADITPDEQRDLWQLASVFDESEVSRAEEPRYVGSLRPGDDFNQQANWRDILEPHGWQFLFQRGDTWYLRRPGKNIGISGTVNWGGFDCFRNFSSSTPFDAKMYSKFSVYGILEHRGDFREAARELVRQGYGTRLPIGQGTGTGEEDAGPAWRQPDPITRPGFPTFPVHALPESVRTYCRSVANSVQVPPDYVAMTILGALSAAARGRFEVTVPGTDYVEPLVLQTVLFADSGTRKSASFAMVKRPLVLYEKNRRRTDEQTFQMWETRVKRKEKDIEKSSRNGSVDDFALMNEMQELNRLMADRPVVTRIVADDVTPERLGMLVHEQRGPIAIMAPEGGFFGNLAGRYNQGIPNMEYVLRGHNGEPLIIDRMGREVMVPASFVTLAISLQPEIVRELSQVGGFRGKGMAARLLPSFPPSLVGTRDVRASEPVDPDEEAIWRSVLMTMLGQVEDCATDASGDYIPYRLILGDSAVDVYYQYAEHVERELAKGGGLYRMRDWGGKMVGHALRIAGLFHLVERGNDALAYPVSAKTLIQAIEVMEYFVPHAKYFLGGLDGITHGEHLEELVNVLRDIPEPITLSSIIGKLRTHKVFKGDRQMIAESLDELELLGYCRVMPGSPRTIEVNPSIDRAAEYRKFESRRSD